MKRCFLPLLVVLLGKTILVFAAPNPTIYQATGLTPADIQPVVDQFRRDISRGGTDNGNLPGPLPIGRREIDWENPTVNGFLAFPEKGALFATLGLRISNDTPPLNFSDIDSSYLTTFQPFGSPRMAGKEEFQGNIGVSFDIPGVEAPFFGGLRYINAVGIVFSDVDLPDSTSIFLVGESGLSLKFDVPARSGDGTLSFLGISFGDQNLIFSVGISAGNAGLAPGQKDGALVDLVAIDRVIFGEPSTVPEPSTIAILVLGLLIFRKRTKERR